jgi:TPR repeat protein
MLVRTVMKLLAALGLLLAGPLAAQEQIPLDYSDANTIERADPDKPADLRAREEAAAKAAETACAARDAAGCAALGKAYFLGEGKPQNRPAAELILRQACDAADADGCLWLGSLFWSVGQPKPGEAGIAAFDRLRPAPARQKPSKAAAATAPPTGSQPPNCAATPAQRAAAAPAVRSACHWSAAMILRCAMKVWACWNANAAAATGRPARW